MKKLINNIITITFPTLFILTLIFELIFRFIIPATDPPQTYFDEHELLYRFDTSEKEGLYTIGKFAQQRGKWRINNFGWNNPIDYHSRKEKNRIAIIGDSYIEAFQIDIDRSYPSLLRMELGKDYDVYSFGISGAPLSQYLHISRYVKRNFSPDILIFNIVHNDFDESIQNLNPFFSYYLTLNIINKRIEEIKPVPDYSLSQYNLMKRLIKKSALFRYVYFNLKSQVHLRTFIKRKGKLEYSSNVEISKLQRNQEVIKLAVEYILNQVRQENLDCRVIIIVDAPRQDIYTHNLEKSNVLFLNRILRKYCIKNGFEILDLTQPMKEDYEMNHIRFNSELDNHWNEYGHKFVFSQVLKQIRSSD